MASIPGRRWTSPVEISELIIAILFFVYEPSDLLNCACLNSQWSVESLKMLYKGSLNDMKLRTPDITSLNCLLVASRERFARNMSFVDHLLLSTETPSEDKSAQYQYSTVCLDKCSALRNRGYSKLLLQPENKGPISLTIPFQILGHDIDLISDLIFQPRLKFLTIDDTYCKALASKFRLLRESTHFTKYSNLEALSVNRSHKALDSLGKLIRLCDLKFFSFQKHSQLKRLDMPDAIEIMDSLSYQQNLKALALRTGINGISLGHLRSEAWENLWPELRALYLDAMDEFWVEKLPEFKELQIIQIRNASVRTGQNAHMPSVIDRLTRSLVRCPQLKVIDIEMYRKTNDSKFLLEIAENCPQLEKMYMSIFNEAGPEMTSGEFSSLLKCLPRIEMLELDVKFNMDASTLRDLACYCPRLQLLNLRNTKLNLTYESLVETPPLTKLRAIVLRLIWISRPQYFLRRDRLHTLAMEWRRVFPRLHDSPRPVDLCMTNLYGATVPWSEIEDDESGEQRFRANNVELNPGPESEDFGSAVHKLRYLLWKRLGYEGNTDVIQRVGYMWQTHFEIDTFGWPVLPINAFLDPISCSRFQPKQRHYQNLKQGDV